jgi:hypothetical protein
VPGACDREMAVRAVVHVHRTRERVTFFPR